MLNLLFMDPPGRDPLSAPSSGTCTRGTAQPAPSPPTLIAVRQADTFLRDRGTSLEAATTADLEAFMADVLARRMASTAATYHKVLKILYGWLAEEEEIPVNPLAK